MSFNTCIKTGVRFQLDGDPEKTFSGDLFWDVAQNRFNIRGIPRLATGEMASFRGPADLRIRMPEEVGAQDSEYATLSFKTAAVGRGLMDHLKEWYKGDFPQMWEVIDEEWTRVPLVA